LDGILITGGSMDFIEEEVVIEAGKEVKV